MVGREDLLQRRCVRALTVRLCGDVSVFLRGSSGGFLRRHISPKLTQEDAYKVQFNH